MLENTNSVSNTVLHNKNITSKEKPPAPYNLDSCRRQELLRETDDAILNTRVLIIFCDIVHTLAMHDIGETDDSTSIKWPN
jgi:hypothetical protein